MIRKMDFMALLLAAILAGALAPAVGAQTLTETAAWAATLRYRITPNITYHTASNFEAKLDVYQPLGATGPVPTVVFIHGGGWVGGTKEGYFFHALPYIEMGWAVVNVEYRLARVALAPAAVEDCRCALRWVVRNAKEYNFDPQRIVVTGTSAGGHLSLMTGLLSPEAGLDRQCSSPEGMPELKVAAVVNFYGITDVNDLLEGVNQKAYAVQWLGSLTDRSEVARRVSPLTWVRPGLPPVLTIHGDADPTVPYTHATRLREALTRAGVPNQLLTIPGGKHGGFTPEEYLKVHTTIREFLARHGLTARGKSGAAPTAGTGGAGKGLE